MSGRVAVLGSLHMDVVVRAPRLPGLDETLMGSRWAARPGGKGGNQAVAAARMGASVSFLGAVGDDDWGRALRANLRGAGVDDAAVGVDAGRGSGMSVAIEDAQGDYAAVVVSGANLGLSRGDVGRMRDALWSCGVLLLQSEVPEEASEEAAHLVASRGGVVVLNAAPARPVGRALLDLVNVLVVNRVEAGMMTGGLEGEAALTALAAPTRDVVLTLGAEGVLARLRDGGRVELPARRVAAASSHGAGDAFCGALAAALAEGAGVRAALGFARDAAGLFVSLTEGERAGMTAERVRAAFAA